MGGGRMDVTSVACRAHLPERASEGHQGFLTCDDRALSAVKLHLSGKELLLRLDDHYQRGPTPIDKQRPTNVTTRK
jgi:hypothetical protein